MNRGITGTLVLSLMLIMLALPGCTSIQDHWTIPDDQPPAAGIPAEEAPPSEPINQDSAQDARLQREEAARREAEAQEEARRQEDARLQRAAAARREAEAQEEARRQEEARLQREAARKEAEAQEEARREEDARLQRAAAARREAEAQEEARRQEEIRLQREAAWREAGAREEARKQEEARRMLEDLEASHRRAEAEERARQEGGQANAGLKPRYYVVRAGDTFNSIAADPLIYSNRNEWYTLYQANKEKMDNPDNPHLLVPGTVIEIPSIAGEIREGTY
jgi:nucleoid-associated protein YgaU